MVIYYPDQDTINWQSNLDSNTQIRGLAHNLRVNNSAFCHHDKLAPNIK